MNVKRKVAFTVLVGTGLGLAGCQAPATGGLAFWNKSNSSSSASATPDVGQPRYELLSKEFGPQSSKSSAGVALGGQKPPANENFISASWKKTTEAISGTLGTKPKTEETPSDPLRLDNQPKKVGPEVYVAAARLMENQSKFAEAQGQYEKALKLAPGDLGALVGLARMHDRQGQSREAMECYLKALKAHPTNSLVYNDLGLCYARQKQFEPALGALRKAVELQPENGKYRNNLAAVLVEIGREDEAMAQLTSATSPAVAHYNIGYLLLQKGRTAEALRHCQQALAIDPGLTPATELLSKLRGNAESPLLAAQSQPRSVPAFSSGPSQVKPQPELYSATPSAMQPAQAMPPSYTFSGGQEVYTGAPLLPGTATSSPPAFHVEDNGPAASTASKPAFSDWSHGGTGSQATMQPLPPVE